MAIDIPDHWKDQVRRIFPQLLEGANFEFTSEVDFNYNCFAWALSYSDKYFANAKGSHWPWKELSDSTVEGYVGVCELHGFAPSESDGFKPGYEKIAIFEDEEGISHACRTDRIGRWKSKLGVGPDIDHDTLSDLGDTYGRVVKILEKRRADWD